MIMNNFITIYDFSDNSNERLFTQTLFTILVGDLRTRINELTIDLKKKLNHTPAFGKARL